MGRQASVHSCDCFITLVYGSRTSHSKWGTGGELKAILYSEFFRKGLTSRYFIVSCRCRMFHRVPLPVLLCFIEKSDRRGTKKDLQAAAYCFSLGETIVYFVALQMGAQTYYQLWNLELQVWRRNNVNTVSKFISRVPQTLVRLLLFPFLETAFPPSLSVSF